MKQNQPYESRWFEMLLDRPDSCLNVIARVVPWGCRKWLIRTLFCKQIFLTFPSASLPVRTVFKHVAGIHCKEFSRKGAILVTFVSNCHAHSEILILPGTRHWEFPPPLFYFSGSFSPQFPPLQRPNCSESFSDWFGAELATTASPTANTSRALEVTNTSGTVRNCHAWNSPTLFKLNELHYPKGITGWTPWPPSITPLLAMKNSMWSRHRLSVQ